MSRSILALIAGAALVGAASTALCSAIATFEGAPGSSNSYPGIAGSGWQSGWAIVQNTGANGVGTLSNTNPVNGGNNYVTFTNTPNPTFAPSTLARQLNTAAKDYAGRFTLSFDIRLESLGTSAGAMMFVLNRYHVGSGSGAEASIMIDTSSNTGVWRVANGDRTGAAPTYINSTVSIAAGNTYSFVIDVDPAASLFDVSINGTDINVNGTTPKFTFRCLDTHRLEQSFVAFKSGGASTSFSLDNLSVVVPEPASMGIFAALGLGVLTSRRRTAR